MKITVKQLRKMIAEAIEAHPDPLREAPRKAPKGPRVTSEPTVAAGDLPPGTRIPLVFSDVDFGTEEFGFIEHPPKVRDGLRSDEEESQNDAYVAHMANLGIPAKVDRWGYVVLL